MVNEQQNSEVQAQRRDQCRIPPIVLIASLLLALMGAIGCERDEASTAPPAAAPAAPAMPADAEINSWLLKILVDHGLPARVVGDWVEVGDGSVRVNGLVEDVGSDGTVVQLAMRLRLADGRVVVQPVVGMGDGRAGAVAHALESFLLGTLHAWLAAFINADEEHLRPERRTIGGRERLVTQGGVVTKSFGKQPNDDYKWRDQFFAALDAM